MEGRREGVDLYGVRGSNVEEGGKDWTEGWWSSWKGNPIFAVSITISDYKILLPVHLSEGRRLNSCSHT